MVVTAGVVAAVAAGVNQLGRGSGDGDVNGHGDVSESILRGRTNSSKSRP